MIRVPVHVPLGCLPFVFASLIGCSRSPAQPPKANEATIRFEDITASAGISWRRQNGAFGRKWMPETFGGGGGFIDYDGDGFLDIVLINGDWWPGRVQPGRRPTLALFRNRGNLTFADVTAAVGLNVPIQGMGVAVGDYDADGDSDLIVTGVAQTRLFRNEGGKRFTDVSAHSGIHNPGWGTSAAWLDFDRDGRLDLFIANYVRWSPAIDRYCGAEKKLYCEPTLYDGSTSRLFRNEGQGKFRDATASAALPAGKSKALGVCIIDVNRDQFPDILVANDLVPNQLLINNGRGGFADQAFEFGVAVADNGRPRGGMGVDAFETAGESPGAVAIGNFKDEGIALYRIEKSSFDETSLPAGLRIPSLPYVTFGLFFADFDLDGEQDLFAANGHIDDTIADRDSQQSYAQQCLLFRGRQGHFEPLPFSSPARSFESLLGRAAARGDVDNDGRPDILVVQNQGFPRLYRNVSRTSNHWLALRLVGKRSNRDGCGANVTILAGRRTHTAGARSGSSYLAANDPRVHIGLGESSRIDRVVVRWPSGVVDEWPDVKVDSILTLTEGSSLH